MEEEKEVREKRIAELTKKCSSMTSVVLGLLVESEKTKEKERLHKKDPIKTTKETSNRSSGQFQPPNGNVETMAQLDGSSNLQKKFGEYKTAAEKRPKGLTTNDSNLKSLPTDPTKLTVKSSIDNGENSGNSVAKNGVLCRKETKERKMSSLQDRIPKKDKQSVKKAVPADECLSPSRKDFSASATARGQVPLRDAREAPGLQFATSSTQDLSETYEQMSQYMSDVSGVSWNRLKEQWEVSYFDEENQKRKKAFTVKGHKTIEAAKMMAERMKKSSIRLSVKNQLVPNPPKAGSSPQSPQPPQTPLAEDKEEKKSQPAKAGKDKRLPLTKARDDKKSPPAKAGEDKKSPQAKAGEDNKLPLAKAGEDKKSPLAKAGEEKKLPLAKAGQEKKSPLAKAAEDKKSPLAKAAEPKILADEKQESGQGPAPQSASICKKAQAEIELKETKVQTQSDKENALQLADSKNANRKNVCAVSDSKHSKVQSTFGAKKPTDTTTNGLAQMKGQVVAEEKGNQSAANVEGEVDQLQCRVCEKMFGSIQMLASHAKHCKLREAKLQALAMAKKANNSVESSTALTEDGIGALLSASPKKDDAGNNAHPKNPSKGMKKKGSPKPTTEKSKSVKEQGSNPAKVEIIKQFPCKICGREFERRALGGHVKHCKQQNGGLEAKPTKPKHRKKQIEGLEAKATKPKHGKKQSEGLEPKATKPKNHKAPARLMPPQTDDLLEEGIVEFSMTPGERAKQRAQEREEARKKLEPKPKPLLKHRATSMIVGAPSQRVSERIKNRLLGRTALQPDSRDVQEGQKEKQATPQPAPSKIISKELEQGQTDDVPEQTPESNHEANQQQVPEGGESVVEGEPAPLAPADDDEETESEDEATATGRSVPPPPKPVAVVVEPRRSSRQSISPSPSPSPPPMKEKQPTVKKVEKRQRGRPRQPVPPFKKERTVVTKQAPQRPKKKRRSQTGTPIKCLSKNNDLCATCGEGGDLICCDTCPRAFHLKCVRSLKGRVPRGSWMCLQCQLEEKRGGLDLRRKRSIEEEEDQELASGCLSDDSERRGELSMRQLVLQNEDPKEGLTLLCLLMYLELVVPIDQFQTIVKYVASMAQSPSSFSWMYSNAEALGGGMHHLNLLGLLRKLGSMIGNRRLVKLLRLLHGDLRSIATGFGLAAPFLEEAYCWECGRLRFLRTICLQCGELFEVSESVLLNLKNLKAGSNHRRLIDRLSDQLSSADQGGLSAAALVVPPENGKISTSGTLESVLERVREGAILRAINYVHQCSLNPDDFRGFGGDMLFLLRNVTSMAVGKVKAHAKKLLHCIAGRWMAAHPHMAEDAEADLILTSIEGMHALLQLGFAEDKSKALPDLVVDQESPSNHKKKIKICLNTCPEEKQLTVDSAPERAESEDSEAALSETGFENGLTPMEEDSQGLLLTRKDDDLADTLSQCSSTGSIAHSRKRRKSRVDTQGSGFHFETFREELHKALKRFDVTDIMGFNPADGKIPYTPTEHCGHCGKTNVRGTKQCMDCDAYLKSKIDYGSLTDAVVWSYLFYEIGLSFDCHNGNISFTEVSRLLPQARCYKSVDEMGHDFFKLQCYFLTHFIYVCSNWGQHALRRELFAEEFEFILGNIKQVIRLDDPELVGEFVQCLRILQVTEERDPDIWPLVQQCMAYLIETERKKGSKGLFVSTTCPLYSRYHASYCGAVGLIDYVYLQPGVTPETPLPSCFMYDKCSDES